MERTAFTNFILYQIDVKPLCHDADKDYVEYNFPAKVGDKYCPATPDNNIGISRSPSEISFAYVGHT